MPPFKIRFMSNNNFSSVAEDSNTDSSSDLEASALMSSESEYNDYYEHVARCEHIRPIAVTEDVNFEAMSLSQKICWWISTAIRFIR